MYLVPFVPTVPSPVNPELPLPFDVIEKLRSTLVAALYRASPDWDAVKVQVPEATIVTLKPETEQMAVFDDDTVTMSPELEVGEMVMGVADHV
jgi:hypothetical protein